MMVQQTGYSPANLTVPDPDVTQDPTTGLRRVQVTASYPFTTIVNWNWPGLRIPSSFTMRDRSSCG